jgi:hypothetical protein
MQGGDGNLLHMGHKSRAVSCAGFVSGKKTEEDATFCLIKDAIVFPLFCLKDPARLMFFFFLAKADFEDVQLKHSDL